MKKKEGRERRVRKGVGGRRIGKVGKEEGGGRGGRRCWRMEGARKGGCGCIKGRTICKRVEDVRKDGVRMDEGRERM